MKMPKDMYEGILSDMRQIVKDRKMSVVRQDHGAGLKFMWSLLNIVSRNRAYEDDHPAFVAGVWKRELPHDGRKFCWYYEGGLNDKHVETALRHIKDTLMREELEGLFIGENTDKRKA